MVLMRNRRLWSCRWCAWSSCGWADKGVGKRAPHAPAGGAAAGLVSVSTTCKNTFSEGKPPSAWGSVPPTAPRASTACRASANRVQCRLRLHAYQFFAVKTTDKQPLSGATFMLHKCALGIEVDTCIDLDTAMQAVFRLLRCQHAIGAPQRPKPHEDGNPVRLLCSHHPRQWRVH